MTMRDKTVTFRDLRDPESRVSTGKAMIAAHTDAMYTEACFNDFDAKEHIEWLVGLLQTGKLPNAE